MIPKVIHYCWFGGNELPELEARCIASWSSVMPEWDVVRWDESNFDVERSDFSRAAYAAGMWSFVSDYARFCILHEHGGVFLDTDVEVLKPFDDLLGAKAFSGFMKNNFFMAPGLVVASEARGHVMRILIDRYESLSFEVKDGRNAMPTSPRIMTQVLEEKYGLIRDGSYQELDGFTAYPAEFFDPLDSHSGVQRITPSTYSIHHYSGTWLSEAKKYRIEARKKLAPKIGAHASWFVSSALSVFKYGRKAF